MAKEKKPASKAAATATKQRAIQKKIEAKDATESKSPAKKAPAKKAVQAGARRQPENPLPAQHQKKPGQEHELDPRPRYLAPDYKGSGKLEDRVAIVTGGDSGIGRAVAVLFAREGANVAIVYLNEHEDADETRAAVEKEGRRCLVIHGDVKDATFCNGAVAATVKAFGRLDILVNNAAFQLHAKKLEDLTDDHLQETLQTNIAGYFHMARAALPH